MVILRFGDFEMSTNATLHKGKKQKNDEFYTQLVDIENELRYYKEHFNGKTVYLNCDDPYESNFFKYFAANFNHLRLERLLATSYKPSPFAGGQLPLDSIEGLKEMDAETGFVLDIRAVADYDGDGAVGLSDVDWLLRNDANASYPLDGDGDFRSPECVELLRQADLVVTNPPFSLFREYVGQLMDQNKQFLIIGHQNAISYKEIFPLIRDEMLWLGYGFKGGVGHFFSPYEDYAAASDHRKGMIRVSGVTWFTNLDHDKRHEELILYREYTPNDYPKYDNYDAINVDRTQDIPADYSGAIGVPITFLTKYNPDQFEILSANDLRKRDSVPFKEHGLIKDKDGSIGGQPKYVRMVIRRKAA